MKAQRRGSDLKTHIRIALHTLGRDYTDATKGKSIAEMETMLAGLHKEAREAGLMKPVTQ
jgi:hypothetical protein